MWISEGTFLSGGMVRSNAQNLDGWTGARFMCSQVDSHQLVTVDVDSQWFGEGLFEASSHITHQVNVAQNDPECYLVT